MATPKYFYEGLTESTIDRRSNWAKESTDRTLLVNHEKQTGTALPLSEKFCLDVCIPPEAGPISTTQAAVGPILITGASVGDVSAAFPAVNQTDRAAFSIRNIDLVESIFIVNSVGITKAAAGIDIWEIGLNETANFDLDDTNKINLVADAGMTVSIQILEIKG